MVANMSDAEIWSLRRGGHDLHKVYAAYAAATRHRGQPTVVLAKTIKGYGMGEEAGEGQNITHQQKEMGERALRAFRDKLNIPISDEDIDEAPFYRPPDDSPEIVYLKKRREELGGFLPSRSSAAQSIPAPSLEAFQVLLKGTRQGKEMSTTMAFVRTLAILLRDKKIRKHLVPIISDEGRTFGMEGLFKQIGIYSPVGQLYEPVDREHLMYYREAHDGQLLQEGISEAGGIASWMAAGSSYANHGIHMIPFFIFYSMFGFQRIGDFIWAAGDMQCRGFLIGGTSGRTTLNGEGLQHQDGHSHMAAANVPNCISYDPTFGYELAVIVQDGLRRMYQEDENIFYYITTMNENYAHPAMPEGVEDDIRKGLYLLRPGPEKARKDTPFVQLLGSGTILNEVLAAAEMLEQDHGVLSDVWSATSLTELRREAADLARWNRLHPEDPPRQSHVEKRLAKRGGPLVAATDYVSAYADQIRAFVPEPFVVLGTDGYGRSDTRSRLRSFFEVDRYHITVAALKALSDSGTLPASTVTMAIKEYGIDPEKPNPLRM